MIHTFDDKLFSDTRKQERLLKLANRGLDQQCELQKQEKPFVVRFVWLEKKANPTEGAFIVKNYMWDSFLEEHPDLENAFYAFIEKGAEMFFLLREEASFLHYWYFIPGEWEPYSPDKDHRKHIRDTDFGKHVYDTYLDYIVIKDSQAADFITKHPERVAIKAFDLSTIGGEGVIVAVYTGSGKPYLIELDQKTLSATLVYILYNSIKIGHHFPQMEKLFMPYNVSKFGGQVFDICASYWLLYGKDRIPSFDEVSYYYQYAHWKNGWEIVAKTQDKILQKKMLYLVLSAEVREYMMIRDFVVPYLVERKIIPEFKKLHNMLDVIYANNS